MAVNVIYLHACGQYVVGSCLYYFETSACIFLASSVQATWPSGHLAVKHQYATEKYYILKYNIIINMNIQDIVAWSIIVAIIIALVVVAIIYTLNNDIYFVSSQSLVTTKEYLEHALDVYAPYSNTHANTHIAPLMTSKEYLERGLDIYKPMNNEYSNINQKLNNIPLYIINLIRCQSRRTHMQQQFDKYNIQNTTFVEAVDGKMFDDTNSYTFSNGDRFTYDRQDHKNTDYEIACTLSHLHAIKTFLASGNEYGIIFEDDISFIFMAYWKMSLMELLMSAPQDWDIISLYCSNPKETTASFKKYKLSEYCGAATYVVNRVGALKLLQNIYDAQREHFNISQFDNAVSEYVIFNNTTSYVYTRTLFIPYNDHEQLNSTIHTDHTNNHILSSILWMKNYYKNIHHFTTISLPKILHVDRRNTNDHFVKKILMDDKSWVVKYHDNLEKDKYSILYEDGGLWMNSNIYNKNVLSQLSFHNNIGSRCYIYPGQRTSNSCGLIYTIPKHPLIFLADKYKNRSINDIYDDTRSIINDTDIYIIKYII